MPLVPVSLDETVIQTWLCLLLGALGPTKFGLVSIWRITLQDAADEWLVGGVFFGEVVAVGSRRVTFP